MSRQHRSFQIVVGTVQRRSQGGGQTGACGQVKRKPGPEGPRQPCGGLTENFETGETSDALSGPCTVQGQKEG